MYLLGYQILTGLNYFFNIIDMVLLLYCLLSFFARGTRIYAMLDRLFELDLDGYVQERASAKKEYIPPFDLSGVRKED